MTHHPRRKRIRLQDEAVYRQDGRVFLVTACTADRQAVFADLGFGRRCVRALRRLRTRRGNPVYAYCLMPDHVHLVVGVHAGNALPAFVQAWKSSCTKVWREAGGSGTFWQRGYHDRALRRHEDLNAACLYVLANPVRKGLVKEWRAYPLCGSLEWHLDPEERCVVATGPRAETHSTRFARSGRRRAPPLHPPLSQAHPERR